MAIEVFNLSKKYGSQMAVDSLSFTANPGEIIGFLGPNGAGKSTTFKMLTTYLSPDSGTININGYNVMDAPMDVRRSLGYLPESNPLYADMYVKEFLAFVARVHKCGANNKDIESLCERVGLTPEMHKKIGQLSKGFRQRVGLAQAIIHDPSTLILDEPTTGLDANQLVGIRKLIKDLGKEKTILFSSHIMQEIEAICDRVIILDKGIKITDQKLSSLQSNAENTGIVEVEFENAVPDKSLFKTIQHIIDIKSMAPNKLMVSHKIDEDIRPDIFRKAVENKLIIIGMNKKAQSMEKIFQNLTSFKK
jgi:ABC-2 type transport system ATP-binding protein